MNSVEVELLVIVFSVVYLAVDRLVDRIAGLSFGKGRGY